MPTLQAWDINLSALVRDQGDLQQLEGPACGARELLDICMTVSGMPNWATSDVLSMPSAADHSAVNGRHAAFCGQLQSQVLYRVTLQLVQVHRGWAGSLGAVGISQPQQGCLGRAAALRRQTSAAGQELRGGSPGASRSRASVPPASPLRLLLQHRCPFPECLSQNAMWQHITRPSLAAELVLGCRAQIHCSGESRSAVLQGRLSCRYAECVLRHRFHSLALHATVSQICASARHALDSKPEPPWPGFTWQQPRRPTASCACVSAGQTG